MSRTFSEGECPGVRLGRELSGRDFFMGMSPETVHDEFLDPM